MDRVKRLNLSFNLNYKKHREAYSEILAHHTKTDFIVEAVLAYTHQYNTFDKQMIKKAMTEVLREAGIDKSSMDSGVKEKKATSDIPGEILDIFNQI